MGFFSIEGKFFRALTKAGDFMLLAIFGTIFSIPIVTIGTSVTAVYYVALKEVRDEEGYVWKDFWKSWKQNLKQSIVIELIIAALGILLYYDFRICYNWAATENSTFARLLMFATLGFIMILVAVTLYVFPVLAKFDNTVLKTFKNSLILAMHHFPQTLAMIIIDGGLILFSVQFFTAFIVTIPVIYYVDAFILERVFRPFVKEIEHTKDEDFSIPMDEDKSQSESVLTLEENYNDNSKEQDLEQ